MRTYHSETDALLLINRLGLDAERAYFGWPTARRTAVLDDDAMSGETFLQSDRTPCIVSNDHWALTAERPSQKGDALPPAFAKRRVRIMHTDEISRSRSLCAQSRRNRAAFEHVIATTRRAIKNSQRLIERGHGDGMSPLDTAKSDMNAGKARKPT